MSSAKCGCRQSNFNCQNYKFQQLKIKNKLRYFFEQSILKNKYRYLKFINTSLMKDKWDIWHFIIIFSSHFYFSITVNTFFLSFFSDSSISYFNLIQVVCSFWRIYRRVTAIFVLNHNFMFPFCSKWIYWLLLIFLNTLH